MNAKNTSEDYFSFELIKFENSFEIYIEGYNTFPDGERTIMGIGDSAYNFSELHKKLKQIIKNDFTKGNPVLNICGIEKALNIPQVNIIKNIFDRNKINYVNVNK